MNTLEETTRRVSSARASLGALESRLYFAVSHLQSMAQEYRSAESCIIDADVAEEVSAYLSVQIKQNAAQAILA